MQGLPILAGLAGSAWLPLVSAYSAPRWWGLMVGGPLLALLWARGGGAFRLGPGHWLGLAFVVAVGVSVVWSASPLDTLGVLVHLLALGAVFAVAAEAPSMDGVWRACGWAACLNVLVMAAQNYASVQMTGTFGNKDLAAEFAALSLVGIAASRDWTRVTPLYGAAVMFMMSVTRGTLIALAVCAVLALVIGRGARVLLVLFVIVLSVAVAAVASRGVDISVASRLTVWITAAHGLEWFGHGAGTFGTFLPWAHAFNDPLEAVFELGVLAALPAVLVIYCLWGGGHDRSCLFVLSAAVAAGLSGSPLYNPATAFMAFAAMGCLAGARHRARLSRHGGGGGGSGSAAEPRGAEPRRVRSSRARGAPLPA